jgi:integrase/recombinase XerD
MLTAPMLTAHVERYVALRRALGFNLRDVARDLRAYARYAEARGDACVRLQTAADWAEQAPSPRARHVRLRRVADLARFLHAEDPAHEVPPAAALHVPARRPLPHIYTPEQLARIVAAAGLLRETYTLRRRTYATLFGLIAATGLRISEALGLRMGDLLPGGVLRIERTKFGKSRLVPLHPTAEEALDRYLDARRQLGEADDHVFLSAGRRRIGLSMADYTFRRVLRLAGIASGRERACRVHDLRHTFATRALERCSMQGQAVARHFVALATYMGHTDIAHTYWYLEATPELMADVAAAGEALMAGESVR